MSSIRAEVYMNSSDEFKLFLEFEEKLNALQRSKYPQATTALMGGLAYGANAAGANAAMAAEKTSQL